MRKRNLCFCRLLPVLMAILPLGAAIVGAGRDLLLTPRQGHQLNGKRIFYEEEKVAEEDVKEAALRRQSPSEQQRPRPWERTLKHVTYVTLFTDAAVNAAAGNLSQLHEYHDFLQTPYLPADAQSGGSVAGSASSRFGDIVTLAKGYLEQLGTGEDSNATTYRFVEGGTCFRLKCPASTLASPKQRRRALWQVQRIRHRDGESGGRPFHYEMKFSVTPLESQAWQPHQPMSYIQKESDYPGSFGRFTREPGFAQRRQDHRAATAAAAAAEQSQATFVHGIFQPAPSLPLPPAVPPKLNIGEYLKGSPKIELFPGLFNLGLRPNYVAPTTFRPNYPALERFPHNELTGGGHGGVEATPGGVTHHFHHHFYVAPGTGDTELAYRLPTSSSSSSDPSELTTPPTSHPAAGFYPPHQTVHFPSSHSGSSESVEDQREQEQEQEHDQEQAVQLLRTPQIYGQASKYQTSKLPPLLIYAGANDEDKSFVQSEPLEETVYRYSEPDPLYVHQNPIDVLPERQQQQQQEQDHQEVTEEQERNGSSLEQPKLETTAAPATTTEANEATEASSTSTSTIITTVTAPHAIPTTSSSNFVSTSTHFSPLRSISRYRTTPRITAGRSTTTTTSTTTEPPISKWAKRRKEQDSKAKSSLRHEAVVAAASSTTTTTTTTEAATPPPRAVVEVLTQKSVSRSVSIKVGENGEEIPILVDDEENEVKPVAIK